MAYIKPDAAIFKARFPEFASLGDPLIGMLIDEADLFADDRWDDGDRRVAVLHLAAHAAQQAKIANMLLVDSTSQTDQSGDDSLFVKSVSFGDRSVTWERRRSITGSTSSFESMMGLLYDQTPYGQMYLRMARRNIGGPLVV